MSRTVSKIESDTKSYFSRNRGEMLEFVPNGCFNILEIGCGEGGFATNFIGKSEYWGVEPNHFACEIARTKLFKVFHGTFEGVHQNIPDNYFDLVICNDVIEHMTDHDSFLNHIRDKMKTDAYIIGSIPNVRYVDNLYKLLLLKDWKYEDWGILDRTHLRFFTYKSLKRTLTENGFLVIKLQGINSITTNFRSFRSIIKMLISMFFGADSKFLQYGFQCRK